MLNECCAHDELSARESEKEYEGILANPEFEKWNTTSLYLLLMKIGHAESPKIMELSLHIYELFLEWARTQEGFGKKCPEHGLEPFPSISELEKALAEIREAWNEDINMTTSTTLTFTLTTPTSPTLTSPTLTSPTLTSPTLTPTTPTSINIQYENNEESLYL